MVALIASLILGFPPQTVTLRYAPPIGKAYRYKVDVTTTMNSKQMPNMSVTMTEVISMKAVGKVGAKTKVETVIESVTNHTTGQMAAIIEHDVKSMIGKKTTMLYGPDGLAGDAQAITNNNASVLLPNHPVRIGDSWSTVIDFSKLGASTAAKGLTMSGKMPMNSKLSSFNQSSATINTTMSGVITTGTPFSTKTSIGGSGTYVVEVATGVPVSYNQTTTTSTSMGSQGSMTQKTTMKATRI